MLGMDLVGFSTLIGYTYIVLWGLGFWPPILTVIKLKSIQGLAIDFLYFNAVGYVFYVIYYGFLLFNPYIRKEYSERYTLPSDPTPRLPLIKLNDFIFATHGLAVNLLTLSFAYWPWSFRKNDNQVMSLLGKKILATVLLIISCMCFYILKTDDKSPHFQWLDLLTSLGLFKILMSVCKNVPQVIYNYNRKSTHGWPIEMIWLDFIGGLLSLLQLVLDASISQNYKDILNNLPKLLLSIEAVIADIVFFLQHYYWYYKADIQIYGPFKNLREEEENFIHEHEHDHDHLNMYAEEAEEGSFTNNQRNAICSVKSTDEGEMQRLIV
ncbi:hypothetical protein PACTADRAFT_4236 [Pachysolen tannophilus NRRL Y-2460]|uniref:Cystinosin n=1 Tax=Pachysolen tannophilus NRRL Y-2460 TaxID=669874 RepID=A0A1E4TRA0_PACTA|nr:hypothetical protein PACTADRAFT_4236 [Pachysolen tannophilus NRRL Y-2460]